VSGSSISIYKAQTKLESEDYESENIRLLIVIDRDPTFQNILDPGFEPRKVRSRARLKCLKLCL
jgi:hypothetical protein